MGPSMNREAEIATMLMVGIDVALFGWALVHIASAPINKDDERPAASRVRRWLQATYYRSQNGPQ
jgi:hypothetical protein